MADGSDAVPFVIAAPIDDSPRCNESGRFSISLRKPGGMAAFMALLEAKKQGYEVTVEGLNTCTNEWKAEDAKNIVLRRASWRLVKSQLTRGLLLHMLNGR